MPTVAEACTAGVWNNLHTVRGTYTGLDRPCLVIGCHGWRVQIRWPDGSVTWPCSRGLMLQADGTARIMRAHADLLARGRAHHFRSTRTDRLEDALTPLAAAAEAPAPSGDPGPVPHGAPPTQRLDEAPSGSDLPVSISRVHRLTLFKESLA